MSADSENETVIVMQTLETSIVDAVDRGDAVGADALLFLLRRYRDAARADLGDAIGRALASALAVADYSSSVREQAAWLTLMVEASALSDDDRLQPAIDALVAALRGEWRSNSIEHAAASIGACLEAASLTSVKSVAADAVDELERMVGGAYRPGQGLGSGCADEVRAASTLLIAYSLCGRLPYAMLAEELIQHAKPAVGKDFVVACDASRVLCRLALLHDDAEYRAAAVIVPSADYRRDAAQLLTGQAAEAARRGASAAIYGVALLELESQSQSDR